MGQKKFNLLCRHFYCTQFKLKLLTPLLNTTNLNLIEHTNIFQLESTTRFWNASLNPFLGRNTISFLSSMSSMDL